jgi:hypothetical protein
MSNGISRLPKGPLHQRRDENADKAFHITTPGVHPILPPREWTSGVHKEGVDKFVDQVGK